MKKYEGEFKNDSYNGSGRLFNQNGSLKYEGNFKNGHFEGLGTYFYTSGSKYIGMWKEGVKEGEGRD